MDCASSAADAFADCSRPSMFCCSSASSLHVPRENKQRVRKWKHWGNKVCPHSSYCDSCCALSSNADMLPVAIAQQTVTALKGFSGPCFVDVTPHRNRNWRKWRAWIAQIE